MSCFIFNLIAIEDKAQIQTFPHIKKLDVVVAADVVCSVRMMVDEKRRKKNDDEKKNPFFSFHSKILLRYCVTNWTSTYLICKIFPQQDAGFWIFDHRESVSGETLIT